MPPAPKLSASPTKLVIAPLTLACFQQHTASFGDNVVVSSISDQQRKSRVWKGPLSLYHSPSSGVLPDRVIDIDRQFEHAFTDAAVLDHASGIREIIMSADLFAAFDSPPTQRPRQGQPSNTTSTQAAPSSTDPFSLLGSASQNTNNQHIQPWPSLESSTNNAWEDFAGGQGSGGASKNTFDEEEEEDGWGDFETAEPASKPNPQIPATALPAPSFARPPPQNPAIQRTRILRAPTIELMTNSLISLPGANALPDEVRTPPWMRQSFEQTQKSVSQSTSQPPKPVVKSQKPDPNVLFDADDFDGQNVDNDDDDFGDFETTVSPVNIAPKDLISDDLFTPPVTARPTRTAKRMDTADMFSGLTLNKPMSPYPQAPRSPSFQDRNPFPGLALDTPTEPKSSQQNDKPKTSPVTAWPTVDHNSAGSNQLDKDWGGFEDFLEDPKITKPEDETNDEWGDWDSFDTKKVESIKPQAGHKSVDDHVSTLAWDAVETPAETSAQANDGKAPPINVPPPSVLLSIFPQLLGEANTSLFKPVVGQAFSTKNRILSDPKTIDFLRGYLLLATVAARVIAGRKQRWHRDKFLAQSMSISAAGSKGMKLAGVDKTQAAREDREAADILDLWKEHIGRLRSSVATANQSIKDSTQHLKIPDLRENIQIQAAKGVLSAPKACVICGLKRDERLARIDLDVEDSFGEWWVEHWGHTACKRFWLKHESALRQR
ncbi:hypothetical protein AB5N19_12731 [Seiridium cardinale]